MIEVSSIRDLESQLKRNKRVLALFYASWCPFCISFLPVFDHSSKQGFGFILCVKVDDYDSPLWDEYSVEAVPTIIFFQEGKVCRRLDSRLGYGLSENEFRRWLEQKTE